MAGFKSLKYDRKRSQMLLWEIGHARPDRIPYEPRFFVKDILAPKDLTDIYGNPVRLPSEDERKRIGEWRAEQAKNKDEDVPASRFGIDETLLCEEDYPPEVVFLQEHYSVNPPDSTIADFKVAYIDIELEGGNGGHLHTESVYVRKVGTEAHEQMQLADFELHRNYAEYEIWEGNRWVPYVDSSYVSRVAPEPKLARYPVNLISVLDSTTDKVTVFGLGEYHGTNERLLEYKSFANETALLSAFFAWMAKENFDIITGWNIDEFDLPYLNARASVDDELLKAFNKISPIGQTWFAGNAVRFAGVVVLDYLALFKSRLFNPKNEPSYHLDDIAQSVCGEGKTEYEGSINAFYKRDWDTFVDYNIQDVVLVRKIDEKKKYLELAVHFAYDSLIPLEKAVYSSSAIDGYILRQLHSQNKVMPNRKKTQKDWWAEREMYNAKVRSNLCDPESPLVDCKQNWSEGMSYMEPFHLKGGCCYAAPGLYGPSLCFDVASLYPHVVMQYNISPETKVTALDDCDKSGLIESETNGVWYRREKGFIPEITERLFAERSEFKKRRFKEVPGSDAYKYFDSMQKVRKVLINAIYGAMKFNGSHLYDIDNSRAITRGGRVVIRFLVSKCRQALRMLAQNPTSVFPDAKPFVLEKDTTSLVDTDSCHVHFDEFKAKCAPDMPVEEFLAKMETYLESVFEAVLQSKADAKGLKQIIRFKREGVITHEFVLAMKTYVSVLVKDEEEVYDPPLVRYTGVSVKKSSTPKFCRENLPKVIEAVLHGCTEDELVNMVDGYWAQFQLQEPDEICSICSISDYESYAPNGMTFHRGWDGLWEYLPKTPLPNKAAIAYNLFVQSKKLPLERISSWAKIRYIHLDTSHSSFAKDLFGNDVIAWIGKCPNEIREVVQVDYEKQFKPFASLVNTICGVMGWGEWSRPETRTPKSMVHILFQGQGQ